MELLLIILGGGLSTAIIFMLAEAFAQRGQDTDEARQTDQTDDTA
ncbi:hypothetical protein [Yoonia sp. BS5-3]|uniref:Uncharacterized protein n=1 Tax=Yoonia phaeophyticola TaxID=3137369 RepID=A0ABZ2V2J6_9RHOB